MKIGPYFFFLHVFLYFLSHLFHVFVNMAINIPLFKINLLLLLLFWFCSVLVLWVHYLVLKNLFLTNWTKKNHEDDIHLQLHWSYEDILQEQNMWDKIHSLTHSLGQPRSESYDGVPDTSVLHGSCKIICCQACVLAQNVHISCWRPSRFPESILGCPQNKGGY